MPEPSSAAMARVARMVESRLDAAGIRLTLGGEPTFVPFEPEGPEWSVAADGPTKLPLARRLARDLQLQVWPGSTLLWCPGKRYEGEVNPRWTLRLISGRAGLPPVRWPHPAQPGVQGRLLTAAAAPAWLAGLGERLGVRLQPLALQDPRDPGRAVWAVPLSVDPAWQDGLPIPWRAAPWPLEPELCRLSGAPGPAGLRLPLEHFPADVVRQVLTLEIGDDGWELFLPPLLRLPLETLLQAVADRLGPLAAPRLSGALPLDAEPDWQVLGITADPGVREVNLPVCHGWSDYDSWLRILEEAGARVGLRSWKAAADGSQEGTGGGNHLLWGGPSLAEHPFFPRPAWLAAILRYWQQHPSLAYLFTGSGVGPASQAPRPDEAAGDLFDLELAYRALEQAGEPPGDVGDHRWLIGETLRHLHVDRSGNNHRCEISFDKFWTPGTPAGCLGLIEFRALESLPHASWSSAIALLWSAMAVHLLEPGQRPTDLRCWGEALHDRQLLPSLLWADLETVLADLAAAGLALDPAPYRAIWEWRFPPLLAWREADARLLLRPAPEPWPLICDFPREGGFTSRFVDASLRRFEIEASPAFRRDWRLLLQGRELPWPERGQPAEEGVAAADQAPLAVRFRFQKLHPCLHPGIPVQAPLELRLCGPGGEQLFRLHPGGRRFDPVDPGSAAALDGGPAWSGRRRPGDVTLDLRLG
ncbi:MAG: transglutaminase family protein [Synechococcaceae cyanobacterium]|nr:transglutaminase family protein [Synechococcaceae cyanobacterium]